MEFWLNLTMVDIDELVPLARAAEAAGFAGVSMGDHLVFPQTINSPYPYSPDGRVRWTAQTHWPDAWVAIAALAQATTRLRFTTGVYVAPLRHPVELAKALSTAARMSGDRVVGGFGAGWMQEEFDLVGEPFAARGARLDEMIEVMRRLWTGDMVEHRGPFYSHPAMQMSPAPARPIPLYFGGHNAAALRRAARNQGWIGVHRGFEETEAAIGRLRAAEREVGPGASCAVMINAMRARPEDVARFGELGVDALVLPVLGLGGEATPQGRLEAIRRTGEALGLPA